MLKLKLQYFGHLMRRVDSLEKLWCWENWGQEEKGMTEDEMAGWHHWLDGRESGWTPGVGDDREAWRAPIHGVAKSRTRLSDWTELNWYLHYNLPLSPSLSHTHAYIYVPACLRWDYFGHYVGLFMKVQLELPIWFFLLVIIIICVTILQANALKSFYIVLSTSIF